MDLQHPLFSLQCCSMQEDDIDKVSAIEKRCHLSSWSEQQFLSSLYSKHACWVVKKDNQIIAYAITSTVLGEAELLNIAVSPLLQNQGVAKVLLQALCDSFADSIETFFLEVRASNTPAIALYQSLDFNEVGQRPNYYPAKNGREDAVIMAKILISPF